MLKINITSIKLLVYRLGLLAGAAMCVLVLTVMARQTPLTRAAVTCQSVALPAYSYPSPTTFWDNSISARPPVSLMIADPANGPGSTTDPNYVTVIAQARAAGIKVFGYVDTSYTAVASTTVEQHIDDWKTLYNISDIFLDQTSSGAGDLSYYQGIADKVHLTPGAITMFNPGTVTDEGYMAMADIINIFEGIPSTYATFTMPSWAGNYSASRFSQLIYASPDQNTMTTVLAQSRSQGAGYVFITDDDLPNPWDTLPPYWANEAAQINAACNPPAPSPSPTPSPSPSGSLSPSPSASPSASPGTSPSAKSSKKSGASTIAAGSGTTTPSSGASPPVITPGSTAAVNSPGAAAASKPKTIKKAPGLHLWAYVLGGFIISASATGALIVYFTRKQNPGVETVIQDEVVEPAVHRPPPGANV